MLKSINVIFNIFLFSQRYDLCERNGQAHRHIDTHRKGHSSDYRWNLAVCLKMTWLRLVVDRRLLRIAFTATGRHWFARHDGAALFRQLRTRIVCRWTSIGQVASVARHEGSLCCDSIGSCHFRVHFNVPHYSSVWYRRRVVSLSCTFQRAVLAALSVTDGGSCHFHCTVLAALCGAGVCLCLFLLLNVVYLPIYAKLWLVVGMTKQNGEMVRR